MNIEEFRAYCLSFKGATESMPFDDKVLVFKVMNKMFCLTNIEDFSSINVKCDPKHAIALREQYEAVQPGYHMSKVHWNTVHLDGSLPVAQILQWVQDSYDLIVAGLTKKLRAELAEL
ncbi:MmcQ/YjbR family DNA-binding protein [bacterium]|nr:MmcQ/YjbR family DNA-binding protein [bacterium]